jgi:large subunit ribosomal protein L23
MYSILRKPLVTEKSTLLQEQRRYAFEVSRDATKIEIKQAIQDVFNVNVIKVNTMTVQGKRKRFGPKISQKKSWKKAIVTVALGQSISLFEGV